ncbi:hypothetical protein BaRGS_00035692 [Batillaria attramentaria]|uniref:Uncharacterized protein n=1 Tax=Batillaria attramentaria TaxID=370345 RepID=A0ABD0JDW1_9CAEN
MPNNKFSLISTLRLWQRYVTEGRILRDSRSVGPVSRPVLSVQGEGVRLPEERVMTCCGQQEEQPSAGSETRRNWAPAQTNPLMKTSRLIVIGSAD